MRNSKVEISLFIFVFLILNPAVCDDWPHWRGAQRNGVTTENSGWETGNWPPRDSLWKKNVGEGASSPVVHQGKAYFIGWSSGKDFVRCLDPNTGVTIWEQSYPNPKYGRFAKGDQGHFRGATATPEFDSDTGILYTLSCDGSLAAWDTKKDGAKIWALNLYDQFNVPMRPQITKRRNTLRDYGYTSSPLVYNNLVVVETGDTKGGCIKAFDKQSGKLIWESENKDPAGHTGGLVPMEIDGVPCVAIATSWNLLVVRVDQGNAGKTVAEYEWKTDFSNTIAGLAAEGQDLLICSRYNQMAMERVNISLTKGAKRVWRNKYPTGVCTPVIHQGNIYFANKGIHCINYKNGRLIWEGGKVGDAGSCIVTADNRLIVWGNGGDLILTDTADRSRTKCNILAQKNRVFSDMAWPHAVAAEGRLYCKTLSGDVACFSLANSAPVKGGTTSGSPPEPWPGEDPDLVIAWKRGAGVSGCVGHPRRTRLASRGRAKPGASGELDVGNGSYHVKGAANSLLTAAKNHHAISLELMLETASLNQRGPARIFSFSKDTYHRNFTIGQEKESLILRLRTPSTGDNGTNPEVTLGNIGNNAVHVVVTYRPGELLVYFDGREVLRSEKIKGDFSNWDESCQLIIGDEWFGGPRDWDGKIHAFAIFQRVLNPDEVRSRFHSVR